MIKKKVPKNIFDIIKMINESNDIDTIETVENYIVCYYCIPVLIIGSLINFILHYNMIGSIIDSIIMLLLCACFVITPYIKIKTRIITHFVSIVFSATLIFVAIRIYSFIGPAIWTISFIAIMISSIRITRVMINYITISTFFMGMYYSLKLAKTPFVYGSTYYIVQVILFGLILIIAPVVHLINQAHYKRANNMYMTEVRQREELEKMYQDIAATHEELNNKYNELNEKNIELKINEEKLFHMAHHDIITELPNRIAIMNKIQALIDSTIENEASFYVVFIDIDSFKNINDTMGHHVGDLFVKHAAQRLSMLTDKEDVIGRIGGDEFALIIPRRLSKNVVFSYLDNIRQEFLKPFNIENCEIVSSASFGVTAYPYDGKERVELIKKADKAMYKAKELGKNNIQFFS